MFWSLSYYNYVGLTFPRKRAHKSSLSEQKDDLHEWEKKVREVEERLMKDQTNISQREEKENENDRILKQKNLKDAQKKIDNTNTTLKRKDDDMSSRLENLAMKEKARILYIELF